jgi:[pyruvate, water dikinase]-phosphate phosphotransferase / [pyruvate, water dikinase] kinase
MKNVCLLIPNLLPKVTRLLSTGTFMKRFHLHLVSDSTGETLEAVAKACLAQFENAEAIKHFWPMIRSERQLGKVIESIMEKPGLVLFTLVNVMTRDQLQARLITLGIPAVSVLDPVLQLFGQHIGEQAKGAPGKQHIMDAAYFRRIDAVHYTMAHDDGVGTNNLEEADIVLIGISRTSKTPTSIYLANRGYKTANVPLVPEVPPPTEIFVLKKPLVVGLTTSPDRLIAVRRNRLRAMNQQSDTDYVDDSKVAKEVQAARRLFSGQDWPVIDVTRRSIEETAAEIITLFTQRQEAAEMLP